MKTYSSNPGKDIQSIREIMERSTRFLSLSGLAGIFAGVCALIGSAVAWIFILDQGKAGFENHLSAPAQSYIPGYMFYLTLDALVVLGLALSGAVYFSHRKARKAGQRLWTISTRQLLIHLMIPLISGGIFILLLILHKHPELTASAMLIFYGLALINAGKFTFGEIHYLGLTMICVGFVAGVFINYWLILWATGFGLMHIIYGAVMYYRHEHKTTGRPD